MDEEKVARNDDEDEVEAVNGRMSITEEDNVANAASDGISEDEEEELSEGLSEDEEDEDYDIYYGGENEDLDDGRPGGNMGSGSQFNNNDDPEYFGYDCLTVAQAKDLNAECVAAVCSSTQVCFWP